MIPCELVAMKLLPVIRRQLVLKMLKEGRKQREIANTLNINESAVSHYLAKRRANSDSRLDIMIKKYIMTTGTENNSLAMDVCRICRGLRTSGKLCLIHKSKQGKRINPEDCKICLSKCV
ncbi:MAG: helix-turn-helix domain-containing protein [Candidatus Micrarchaeia archaeon]